MSKMMLGTVQLGTDYGINNQSGMPNKTESNQILEYAYDNGIMCLDTASAYGVSEQIIGEFMENTGKKFNICTKLSVEADEENIVEEFGLSCRKLKVNNVFLLYLHRFEQCHNSELIRQLINLKMEKRIQNIGISIYETDELEDILRKYKQIVDYIQIPFNLFDNARWLEDDLLRRAIREGLKIVVRSVYLQGLFFLNDERLKAEKTKSYNSIMEIRKIARQNNISVAQLAINFVNSFPEIEAYLIGTETLEQIKENVDMDDNISCLSKDVLNQIYDISSRIDKDIIDPRKWS